MEYARNNTHGIAGWGLIWFGFEIEEEDTRMMVILASRKI